MSLFNQIVSTLEYYIWSFGPSIAGESIPIIVLALLGTGLFLTIRLRFLQFRKLGHGFAVTSGKYDNPTEPGDVSHFQALTTALSATVGIGNIAGVAIAIHFGGPGALFWMWITAILGMATKYTEVTLAQHHRVFNTKEEGQARYGSVSGGPMYYIERGLGLAGKPLSIFFATSLILASFFTGNGVQANTVADVLVTEFGISTWTTGLVTSTIVFLVIVGGISRIGRVTSILAPLMATIYISAALIVLIFHYEQLPSTLLLIVQGAFNPSAGVAGTGAGLFVTTMMWGVRRGLFSNEAGMGSAPIAHSAAKTDEPVSEGVVALLEPFIDTIVICSMTGLVILTTGVWNEPVPTHLKLSSGDITFQERISPETTVSKIQVLNGKPDTTSAIQFAWHDVVVDHFFLDPNHRQPFTGVIEIKNRIAITADGQTYKQLYGLAVENGAPLTALAFQRGLLPLGDWGHYVVILSVLLFAISTAISWSYYGDRCANYLFGIKAVLPYKILFVFMHFLGAIFALSTVWTLGDIALGLVVFPNLIALILLSGTVRKFTKSYFERKPWLKHF